MAKKITKKEFLSRAIKLHGDRFCYDNINYVKYTDKISIYCKACDEYFLQSPKGHLNSNGCKKCSAKKLSIDRLHTTDTFISHCINMHGDKYDYSETLYVNALTDVKIFCKRCKKFFYQNPSNHKSGANCPICSKIDGDKKKRLTTASFIEKSISIHGDKYSYEKAVYKNGKNEVLIYCKSCGIFFSQVAQDHMRGAGCKKCANKKLSRLRSVNTNEFIEKAMRIHGDKFDYTSTTYISIGEKIEFICNKCGKKITQNAHDHLRGRGCSECYGRKVNTEKFIKSAKLFHGDVYDYSDTVYISHDKKVKIFCRECNSYFYQTPSIHTCGGGCPKCKMSSGEKRISCILKSNNIVFSTQFKFDKCVNIKRLPFDFYIDRFKTCIEYDGVQHFKPIEIWGGQKGLEYRQNNDSIKNKYCKDNNIKLIRIPYWDFKNIEEILIKELNL